MPATIPTMKEHEETLEAISSLTNNIDLLTCLLKTLLEAKNSREDTSCPNNNT